MRWRAVTWNEGRFYLRRVAVQNLILAIAHRRRVRPASASHLLPLSSHSNWTKASPSSRACLSLSGTGRGRDFVVEDPEIDLERLTVHAEVA